MRTNADPRAVVYRAVYVLLAAGMSAGCGSEPRVESVRERTVAVPAEPVPARPDTHHGIGVALTGRAIRADAPTVPQGDVAFSVTNSGARAYTFVVRGEGLEARTEPVQPGGTALLTTSLKPGVYELLTLPEQESPVPGDIRRTLRVTEGGAAPAPR